MADKKNKIKTKIDTEEVAARAVNQKRADSGRGWPVTQGGRTRRSITLVTGVTAAADYHLDKLTLGQLRELCRMHDRRSGVFSGILDRAVDNIFGSSFDFIPRSADEKTNKTVKAYIRRQMQPINCDAAGEMGFEDLCHIALRAVWNDGDVLGVKRADGTLLNFEADQIESPSDAQGKNITLGVEKNEAGKPLAFYVRQRPAASDSGTMKINRDYARITRNNVFWPAFRKRFGQTRGIPVIAAALSTYGRLDNYIDFESLAAEGNAMQGVKITKDISETAMPGNISNTDTETNSTFEKAQKFEPFSVWELAPGEDIEMVAAERPGNQFTAYTQMMLRIVGVAVGYPLELILLDSSLGNFSNYRGAMLIAKKNFERWQLFFEQKFCLPWYRWQIARGIASGQLPPAAGIFEASIQWPGWQYIKPLEDAQANDIEIGNMTKSVSQCIRDKGGEPEEVFSEILKERQWFEKNKLKIILRAGSLIVDEEEQAAQTAGAKQNA